MDFNNKFLKKAVSVAVSSALLMNSSAVIFAQEEQPLSVSEPEEVVSSAETGFTSDELLLGYFENELYGADTSGAATFALGNSSSFEGKSKEIYDGLKTLAESVAAGTQASTAHTFTFDYTFSQLGLGETPTDEQFKAALDAEIAKYNMPTVVGCLIRDCPYEFYWYGNTYTYGYSTKSSGSDVTMEFTVSFTVGNAYAGNEEYTVDTAKTSVAAEAANSAESIVKNTKANYTSLYDRLVAYKTEICNLVSYNKEAAENLGSGTIDDGNPWQVIYVFDGDTSTNVVCEGYAKAFQYLCDLDGGIDCYCVSGDMQVNADEAEPHMWNIVSIDGANYLVDITNCDKGSIGDPSELFLVGMGKIDDIYTKSIGTDNVHYAYDDYTKQYFSESILKISETNYEIVGGECGEKANWKLGGGTLTIYGEGDIKIGTEAPWRSYSGGITAVVIEEGITSVPAEAFAFSYRDIKTLTIASTVTTIGDKAFQTCTSLESVIFSGESQLTSIGTLAFEACEALKSIEIPKSVETIGKNGFSSCIKLETVTLDDESKLTVLDYTFPGCSALKSINIPKSVTNIGNNTFAGCSSLESINIPKSVTNIGNSAFTYCSSLSEVTINSKEVEFGYYPFNGSNIKTLNIPCSTLTPEKITEFFGSSVTVNYKHDIKYSTSGSVISCVCSDCSDEGTAEVKAEKAVYDGKAHEATVTKTGTFADEEILVTYAVKGGEKLESAPVAAGDYTASITYGEYTASVDYTIEKATPVVEVKANPSSDIADKTITVTATAKNPENEALTDVPALVLTYKVGENGTETEFVGSFVIPEGTADGTEIIVTAKTAEGGSYNAAASTASVVVEECKHTDKTTAWTTDETNHWHICNLCNAEVDKAAHISDSGKITTPPTATTNGVKIYSCTECGYVIKTEAIPATGGEGESAPAVTTPAYTGRPSWVTTPAAVTTTVATTTTTTTTSAPADENEEVKVEDDTDTTRPADDENQPQIKGENGKQGWEVIEDEISDANDGDKIVVDMNGADEVPKDIFKAIKGMDIELVIELGNGFIWTINGEDVTKPIAVNLGIGDEENIPVDIIIKVAGECGYETFAINHDGDFGFTATLTVDLGEENEGLYANLYWYTNGGMEFICADKINSKGKADLKFTHASEYIIVIDEENHGKRAEVSEEAEESEDTDDTDVDEKSDDVIVTDEDDMNPATGVAISFAGIAISAAAVLLAKKRNK